MKTLTLITLFFIQVHLLFAQRVIENPNFKGTTASYIKILKIELTDTATAIDFRVHFSPNMWIRVPSDTYIQNSAGGDKLFVRSAKGIKINEEHFTPENGVNEYTLYFPPLDKNVETFDYQEAQWKIFGIELKPQEHFSIFPAGLLGNWLRTDGSNEWVYGFFDDFVIYESEIWKQVLISQKDDLYTLVLRKNGKSKKLVIKQQGENLLIGPDETNMEPFSREETVVPGFSVKNDEAFQLPVFKKDSAFYSGYIKGYVPQMGGTGMIYVNNILSQEQESYIIKINPDGTFHTGFPMIYPQPVYVRFLNVYEGMFFEPGETTFQFFDFSKYHDAPGPNNLFMGKTAKINSDLMAMKSIRYFDYNNMTNNILDMSAEEYKAWNLEIADREKKAVEELRQKSPLSKKGLQIKQMQIDFTAKQNILSYNMNREGAYRQKNNIPRDQREIPLKREELPVEFYNFINPEEINNPMSLIAGGDYYILINRLKYADPVSPRGSMSVSNEKDIIKGLESRNIEIDPKVKDLMLKLAECKSNEERTKLVLADSATLYSFVRKHKDVYMEISMEIHSKQRERIQQEAFKKYFNLEPGFAREVMKVQDVAGKIARELKPLSETEKENLKTSFSDPFIIDYLLELSGAMEEKVIKSKEAFESKGGFVVNKTPVAKDLDLFDTIMKKYKGNVVFVDFWATWCGPCRSGMQTMKPLKEELKNEKIKFVYLTNPTSPKTTWETMIPDIDGEHYYLTQDEWNTIAARFKVSGIPHYVLVDKTGKVANEKVYFASSNVELKKLFEPYLKN
jgi:thiol-disulfide isomerase/thioredoxin